MDQGECTDSPRVVRVCDRACPLSGGETHGPAGGRSKCPIPCSSRCRCMHVMRVSCRAGCRRGRSAGRASRDPSLRARGASQGRVMSNKQASQLPAERMSTSPQGIGQAGAYCLACGCPFWAIGRLQNCEVPSLADSPIACRDEAERGAARRLRHRWCRRAESSDWCRERPEVSSASRPWNDCWRLSQFGHGEGSQGFSVRRSSPCRCWRHPHTSELAVLYSRCGLGRWRMVG